MPSSSTITSIHDVDIAHSATTHSASLVIELLMLWNGSIMQATASYTCQRCLSALSTAPRRALRSSITPRLATANRHISSRTQHGSTRANVRIGKGYLAGEHRLNSSFSQAAPKFDSGVAYAGSNPVEESDGRVLLQPNNLFHPMSKSPSPDMRRRAAFIKQNAYCPHPDHSQNRMALNPDDPEARKSMQGRLPPAHVKFECPDCGIPVSCSEEHWADDYEAHLEICDTLREINEDDHDMRSGRFFPEFEYPGYQIEEAMVNMTNWDTFMFSRGFEAINAERSMRHATRLLTYPVTVGSILHELSPYNIKAGGRLTVEGLKSLSGKIFHTSICTLY